MNPTHRIIIGDCMDGMASLPDGSVHCCITSPPYWGLRDYGCDGQIGLEATPDAFVAKMVAVFREVRRVLREDGTLWLNLGDSYFSAGGHTAAGKTGFLASMPEQAAQRNRGTTKVPVGHKPKDLVGIPWRVAFALQADGWWLRQDIIWAKPNPMPESVTDRCTKAHEYVFLLSKSATYYYDAEAVKEAAQSSDRTQPDPCDKTVSPNGDTPWLNNKYAPGASGYGVSPTGRNRRSVWTVPTAPYSEAHFATYPPKLIEPMILAGTSAKGCCSTCGKPWERVVESSAAPRHKTQCGYDYGVEDYPNHNARRPSGAELAKHRADNPSRTTGWRPACTCGGEPVPCTVLDPFGGSGTTAAVALQHGRNAIICELNPEYAKLAERRIGEATRPDTYRDESKVDDAGLWGMNDGCTDDGPIE